MPEHQCTNDFNCCSDMINLIVSYIKTENYKHTSLIFRFHKFVRAYMLYNINQVKICLKRSNNLKYVTDNIKLRKTVTQKFIKIPDF